MGRLTRIAVLILFLAPLLLNSCRRDAAPAREDESRTYPVTGLVRSIDFAGRTVTVEHADIPGFMPAMTMPFDVKPFAEAEPLKAGEAIRFRLVVTKNSSWIEGITKIDRSEVQLPETASATSTRGEVARLKEGEHIPDFKLTDSKNREIMPATFAGKPLLLTFIYTRCPLPNFCPLVSRNMKEISEAVADDQALQLLSISIDPEHDTPGVLAQYASLYTDDTDRWRFARGTPGETRKLTEAFAVAVQTEGATLNHSLTTALIWPDGKIARIWRGNGWKPAEVVEALQR